MSFKETRNCKAELANEKIVRGHLLRQSAEPIYVNLCLYVILDDVS